MDGVTRGIKRDVLFTSVLRRLKSEPKADAMGTHRAPDCMTRAHCKQPHHHNEKGKSAARFPL